MRGKIERPNGVSLLKELLFIRPYVLGLHPALNPKKNVKYFFVTFSSLILKKGVYCNPYFTINNPDTEGGISSFNNYINTI